MRTTWRVEREREREREREEEKKKEEGAAVENI